MSSRDRQSGRKEKRQDPTSSPKKSQRRYSLRTEEYLAKANPNQENFDTPIPTCNTMNETESEEFQRLFPLTQDRTTGTSNSANTNMERMSTIVEQFSTLFDAATGSPSYTAKLTDVLTPLFEHLSETIRTDIKEELKSVKEDVEKQNKEIDHLKRKVEILKQTSDEQARTNTLLTEAVQQQQMFLESVDFDKRRHNLIITGLSENIHLLNNNGEQVKTDEEKVAVVLSHIGKSDVDIAAISRLGKLPAAGNQQRIRPIKLTLKEAHQRKGILQVSKNLKTAPEPLRKIYIKSDTHPGIRREMKRLRDVERREKDKPENQGRNVWYDWKERQVKVDNQVIDSYRPTFF